MIPSTPMFGTLLFLNNNNINEDPSNLPGNATSEDLGKIAIEFFYKITFIATIFLYAQHL